jgi:1-acyl-sn-glycerol-3-phosphate acyltransferase
MNAGRVETDCAARPSGRDRPVREDAHRHAAPAVPRISPWLLGWFRWYSARYLRRHFHAVRLSRAGRPDVPDGRPLIVYLNHAAWWDPLVGLILAERLFPRRATYAPIEAKALGRYRFLERLGLFGIDPDTRSGTLRFLRLSRAILARGDTALWITPEGRFADPRERPVPFRPGLAHLARPLRSGVLLPLALEYPFWEERTPEALARFGESIPVEDGSARSVADWNALLEAHLRATQDALAEQAIRRDEGDFEVLLRGRAGVGGVYDVWRRLRARLRGETFSPQHGEHDRGG